MYAMYMVRNFQYVQRPDYTLSSDVGWILVRMLDLLGLFTVFQREVMEFAPSCSDQHYHSEGVMQWPNLPIPVPTLTHASGQQFQSAVHYMRWEILERLTEILWVSIVEITQSLQI